MVSNGNTVKTKPLPGMEEKDKEIDELKDKLL